MSPPVDSLVRIERLNYLIGGLFCVGAALFYGSDIALGVAVGVALTCLNFMLLRRLITRWTQDAAKGVRTNRMILVLPKMIGLMGAVVAALHFLPISPVAFAAGFSIFLFSIVIGTVWEGMSPSPDDQKPDEHQHG